VLRFSSLFQHSPSFLSNFTSVTLEPTKSSVCLLKKVVNQIIFNNFGGGFLFVMSIVVWLYESQLTDTLTLRVSGIKIMWAVSLNTKFCVQKRKSKQIKTRMLKALKKLSLLSFILLDLLLCITKQKANKESKLKKKKLFFLLLWCGGGCLYFFLGILKTREKQKKIWSLSTCQTKKARKHLREFALFDKTPQ